MLIVPHRAFVPPAGLLAREGLRRERGLYVPDRRIHLPGVRDRLRRAITTTNIGTANTAGTAASSLSVTSITVPILSLVLVAVEDTATAAGTVSDTKNTYTLLTSAHPNNSNTNGTTMLFWSVLTTALTGSDTIKYTVASGTSNIDVSALYATGCSISNPVDAAVTSNSAFGSSTSVSGTGGTPGQSGELFVAVVGAAAASGSATLTNPGGWSTPPTTSTQTGPMIGGGTQVGGGSAPSYSSGTLSTTSRWALILAGFKPDFPMAQIMI